MFEAMLYAALWTLNQEGLWNGAVRGAAPAKVGSFWIGGQTSDVAAEPIKGRTRPKTAKVRNKSAKVDIVGHWLEQGDTLDFQTEEARSTMRAYLSRWRGKGKIRAKARKDALEEEGTAASEGELSKLDDLADCLLQGVAWIRWEENRKRAVESSIGSLLEATPLF